MSPPLADLHPSRLPDYLMYGAAAELVRGERPRQPAVVRPKAVPAPPPAPARPLLKAADKPAMKTLAGLIRDSLEHLDAALSDKRAAKLVGLMPIGCPGVEDETQS